MKNKKESLKEIVRRVIKEEIDSNQYTEKDLKFVDGKCVLKNGRKMVARIYYRPVYYKINNIPNGYSHPYALEIPSIGQRGCNDIDEVLTYLNKYVKK
jgi:hypothetical protein